MKAPPASVQDYLRSLPDDRRLAFERLRAQIRAVVPESEECISYGMPAFRVPGGVVAGFLATKKGCSYYPFSGRTLKTLADAVSSYSQTPGALHFATARGLPPALVRKLLRARLAELATRAATAKPPAKHREKTAKPAKLAKPSAKPAKPSAKPAKPSAKPASRRPKLAQRPANAAKPAKRLAKPAPARKTKASRARVATK